MAFADAAYMSVIRAVSSELELVAVFNRKEMILLRIGRETQHNTITENNERHVNQVTTKAELSTRVSWMRMQRSERWMQ